MGLLYMCLMIVVLNNEELLSSSVHNEVIYPLDYGPAENITDNVSDINVPMGGERNTDNDSKSSFETEELDKLIDQGEYRADNGIGKEIGDSLESRFHNCTSKGNYSEEGGLEPKDEVAFISANNVSTSIMSVNGQETGESQCLGFQLPTNEMNSNVDEIKNDDNTEQDKNDGKPLNITTEKARDLFPDNFTEKVESGYTSSKHNTDTDLDKKLTFTCSGRCHEKWSFPCSCSEVCVLYKTCCENMSRDCPENFKRGREVFAAYLHAEMVCKEDRVYKIASCPSGDLSFSKTSGEDMVAGTRPDKGIPAMERSATDDASTSDSCDDELNQAGSSLTLCAEEIEQLVLNAPVTDGATGITYLNSSIRDCYIKPGTARKQLGWGLQLSYSWQSPEGLQSLASTGRGIQYLPVFNTQTILAPHLCYADLINTCQGATHSSRVRADDVKRCGEFTGVVKARDNLYRNRYCAYCHEGRNAQMMLDMKNRPPSDKVFQLRVIVSLTADGDFYLRLNKPVLLERSTFTWKSAVCPRLDKHESQVDQPLLDLGHSEAGSEHLHKQIRNDSASQCRVTCDDERFTLRSDGRCKAIHTSLVAFADDGLPPLSEPSLTSVARFVSCGVNLLLKDTAMLHVEFLDPTSSIGADHKTNKSLYIVHLKMDIPNLYSNILSYKAVDVVENVAAVAWVLKAVRQHRKLPDNDMMREAKVGKATPTPVTVSAVESAPLDKTIISNLKQFTDMTQAMSKVRGPIIDQVNTTTLCVSKTKFGQGHDFDLFCLDDADYEGDAENIDKLLTSHCGKYIMQQSHGGLTNLEKNKASGKLHLLLNPMIPATFTLYYSS